MLVNLRHKLAAPPLRGCVRHVTANAESVEYETTLGVAAGCPAPLLVIWSHPLLLNYSLSKKKKPNDLAAVNHQLSIISCQSSRSPAVV